MQPRLSSDMLVGALIRRTESGGGHAMVLAKGDRTAGAIVIACSEKGRIHKLVERAPAMNGGWELIQCGPQDIDNQSEIQDYIDRRRGRDPDLWVIELDIAEAERFAAETIC
ncbi:DUF1491 family protein [Sphingobium boeckii]|uniref:DUF1491 family protein n=1 Tax=Sphingobium boeckii TaxID=1082345 RepID=A0A7W9EDX3_9SPHN|nr:DUF1491 family protein [Sphingobium boeckii]MBB5684081.1 hypothetical protein [Sphingobium boeckii]